MRALSRCEGVEAMASRRAGERRVDLGEPETFQTLLDFDLVINCADSLAAPPMAAARYLLVHGGAWVDMSAEPATVDALLALSVDEPKGHVIVGAGLFPGLSTMLGRYVSDLVSPCARVDVGVRLSPLSGSGPGNCRVMVDLMRQPGYDIHDAKRRQRPAIGPGRVLPYIGSGPASSLSVTLPDTALVRRVCKAPQVASQIALVPGWLAPLFSASQWLIDRAGMLREALLAMTYVGLLLVRATVLRWAKTQIQLTAVANAGQPDETSRALAFADGRDGTAQGVAAAVLLWRDLDPPEAGTYCAAGLFGLDEALVRLTHAGFAPPVLCDPAAAPRPPNLLAGP